MRSSFVYRRKVVIASLLAGLLLMQPSDACTVVRYRVGDQMIVARNHDWIFGEGLLLVNPRGLIKKSITPIKAARWESEYGSVCLTQFGREIPFAGMNEAGLTVDLLQLMQAKFPAVDKIEGKAVNVIQWVQYQLDTAGSVDEVVASLDKIVPVPLLPSVERVHFFVTDATGDVAVIEFLDGKSVVYRGDLPEHCATANDVHSTECEGIRETRPSRYRVAVNSIDQMAPSDDLDQATEKAFDLLRRVSQPQLTRWSLVYQPGERRLIFQTAGIAGRRWIDLDQCDFSPGSPTLAIDVLTPVSGNLSDRLLPVTPADNERIVHHAMNRYLPEGMIRSGVKQLLIHYPSMIESTEPMTSPAK
jgi:penicillin V acylase-like amidase (Ntn superfamily)